MGGGFGGGGGRTVREDVEEEGKGFGREEQGWRDRKKGRDSVMARQWVRIC